MNNMKTIDPANLKAGMYVLCTQVDNGNQFIGKVQKIEDGIIHFDYTLRDDGTNSDYCKDKISSFTYADCSMFKDAIDFTKDIVSLDKPEVPNTSSVCSNNDVEKRPFNFKAWEDGKYPLVTKDGRKVRFITSGVKGQYNLLMLVEESGVELPVCYNENGLAGLPGENKGFHSVHFDGLNLFMLVEKPKPITKYARVYRRDNTGTTFMSQLVNDPKEFDEIEVPTGVSVVKIIPIEL